MGLTVKGGAPMRQVMQQGHDAARSPQLEWLARAGMAARAAVYAIIGVLALKLALGDGGKATNQQGALKTIAGGAVRQGAARLLAVGLSVTPPGGSRAPLSATGARSTTTGSSGSPAS